MQPPQGLPQNKIPYTPSETKRYEVSEDIFSRRRIKFLRDLHHKMEAELGFPISFSIFGSLIKGKILNSETATSADIDLSIDLDSENFEQQNGFRNLRIREILKNRVRDEIKANAEYLGYTDTMPPHSIGIIIIDNTSIRKSIEYVNSQYKNEFNPISAQISVATFFTLSIGSVVKKYRNKFLLDLVQQPDQVQAEKTWQLIKDDVEKIERRRNIPQNIEKHFPKTLADALKFYGVKK